MTIDKNNEGAWRICENINDEKIEKWIEDCPEHDTEILTTNEDGIVLVVRFNNQKTTNK